MFVLNRSFGSHVKANSGLREARGLRLGGFLRSQDLKEEERFDFQGILGLNSAQVGVFCGSWRLDGRPMGLFPGMISVGSWTDVCVGAVSGHGQSRS